MIRRRLLALAVIAALCAACATQSPQRAAADPREKDPTFRYGNNPGPSPVGVIPDILIEDKPRNRRMALTIEYPTRTGPHPVIVFSHGGGGSNRGYPGLSSHWTSYGYVVIRPSHDDRVAADQLTTAEWRERARDITLVLDSLASLQQQYPELQGKVDESRVAVAGHSRGAVTAMMLGGLRTFPGPTSFADPRVKAIVALSPTGPREEWGVTNESFAEIRVPALFMTGSRDTGATEAETPAWRQQAFELAAAGDKWLVTIDDVQHGTFTGQLNPQGESRNYPTVISQRGGVAGPAPADVERQRMERARMAGLDQRVLFGTIRSVALAFFDAYLKDDPKGRAFLEEAGGRTNVEVKRK
jgi:predicted dienelactone hydrolase